MSIADTLVDISHESALNKAERMALRQIAIEIEKLQAENESLQKIVDLNEANEKALCDEIKKLRGLPTDFTKKAREIRKGGATHEQWEYATLLMEACDIIDRVTTAARKLTQCFPDKIEGEEQRFDIPRYIIEEFEQALKGES